MYSLYLTLKINKYKIKHQLIQGFISDEEWKAIFLIPTLSPVENKIKDLQYKVIMRFVPTNYLLYKMKKVSSQFKPVHFVI